MPNDFNVGNAVKQLIWTGVWTGAMGRGTRGWGTRRRGDGETRGRGDAEMGRGGGRGGGGGGGGGRGGGGAGRRGAAGTRRWGDAGTGRGNMAGWRAPARFAGLWRGMWRRLRSSKTTCRSPFWTTGRCFPAIAC